MQNRESTYECVIDVRYCCICGKVIKGEPLKDPFGNLYDSPFCYDLSHEVVSRKDLNISSLVKTRVCCVSALFRAFVHTLVQ